MRLVSIHCLQDSTVENYSFTLTGTSYLTADSRKEALQLLRNLTVQGSITRSFLPSKHSNCSLLLAFFCTYSNYIGQYTGAECEILACKSNRCQFWPVSTSLVEAPWSLTSLNTAWGYSQHHHSDAAFFGGTLGLWILFVLNFFRV